MYRKLGKSFERKCSHRLYIRQSKYQSNMNKILLISGINVLVNVYIYFNTNDILLSDVP